MAKSSLPSVDGNATAGPQQKQSGIPEVGTPYPVESYTDQLRCYSAIDVRLRRTRHKVAFRDKLRELIDEGATLEDGKPVSAKTDVIKWFLENCV